MNMMRRPAERPWRAALARSRRLALEDIVERAIALLDALDGDPEAEGDVPEENIASEIWGGAHVAA